MKNWWILHNLRRDAKHHCKYAWKLVSAQRDILPVAAISAVEASIEELRAAIRSRAGKEPLSKAIGDLQASANRWLKPYPHPNLRENVEVLLVAIAVAMGIRTFIAQPFKIPTGSMQPTLFGVTSSPDHSRHEFIPTALQTDADFEVPGRLARLWEFWYRGIGYDLVKAGADGYLADDTQDVPSRFLLFNFKQSFYIGGVKHTVMFPPDKLLHRAGLMQGGQIVRAPFKKGDTVIKLKSISGDHLFVDRVTYNFRRPMRGEIVVFNTKDIPGMRTSEQGQFYIKRLVALGGERVRIGDDRHLVINGQRLDASTAHFEKVYSFKPGDQVLDSAYSGHLNNQVGSKAVRVELAPLFPNGTSEFIVPDNHYMVMGDNTVSSSDSRSWGPFPRENIIGRSWMVYWPVGRQDNRSSRFGFGVR